MASYTSAKAPALAPIEVGKWSIYSSGNFASGSQADSANASGFKYNIGGGGIGGEFRSSARSLVGVAFNYSQPKAALDNNSGSIKLDSYQFAGYTSVAYPNFFIDAALSGGFNTFEITRPGVVDQIQGSPAGNVFAAGVRAGYLFDVGLGLQAGPVAGLTYSRAHVDAYFEAGDFVLIQSVGSQNVQQLTGGAGVQLRYMALVNGRVLMPYVNVTAEHGFLDGDRIINTIGIDPVAAVPVYTPVSNGRETYGRVAGGIAGDVRENVRLAVDVQSTFARTQGEDLSVSGKISFRF